MSLSYRVTFLCNGCSKLIIHQKVLYDTFFIKKLVKWWMYYNKIKKCNACKYKWVVQVVQYHLYHPK